MPSGLNFKNLLLDQGVVKKHRKLKSIAGCRFQLIINSLKCRFRHKTEIWLDNPTTNILMHQCNCSCIGSEQDSRHWQTSGCNWDFRGMGKSKGQLLCWKLLPSGVCFRTWCQRSQSLKCWSIASEIMKDYFADTISNSVNDNGC